MLVLTRNIGDSLIIGDNIEVAVLGIKGNQVRIGINAPKDVSVHREEIYERIKAEERGEKPVEGKPSKNPVLPETTIAYKPAKKKLSVEGNF